MRKIILLCCAFALLLPVAAQTSVPDTLARLPGLSFLDKYREMALAYNDDLKAAEKNIAASIDIEKVVRADRGPKLAAGSSIQYTGNPLELNLNIPGASTAIGLQGKNLKYDFSATLLQPIYTGGRILESIRMAQSQQSVATSQAEMLRSLVCFQTDMQYWNTVARLELCNIAAESRNSMRSLTGIIHERVEVGVTDPQDLLFAEVKLNEAEYQLLQAQSNFETGRMALNSLIGVPLDTPTQIDSRVAQVRNAATVMSQQQLRPEIKMAQEQIKLETSTLRLNDAQYKPQLHLGANGGYYSPGYNFHPDLSPNYAVYAQVSVPIFEWGKRRKEKRVGQQRIGIATDNLHRVETEVELETRTAWTALMQAMQRADLAFSSLDKAQENERRATEKYEEGAISVSEVIDAQVYRQTAQVNYVQAKAAAQMHYSEWVKSIHGYDY